MTSSGKVYLTGFGEHLYNSSQDFFFAPARLRQLEKLQRQPTSSGNGMGRGSGSGPGRIKGIACGQSHVVLLTEDGNVVTFGSADYGQLGHGCTGMSV